MACTKACERTGLLDVGDELSIDVRKKTAAPCSTPKVLCLLVALVVIAFGGYVYTHDPISKMTPEGQMALLNSESADVGPELLPSGCRSTLVLMRHCEYVQDGGVEAEDEMGNQHCSEVGLQRSEYVATLFGNETTAKWPLPKLLYAMSRGRTGDAIVNNREIETLSPLSNKSGAEIDTSYSEGSERRLADEFFQHLSSGELCDQATVISWRDKRIPTMAAALGCGQEDGCPEKYKKNEFDKVWELKHTYYRPEGENRRELKTKDKPKKGWSVKSKVVKQHFTPTSESEGAEDEG